MHNKTYIAKMTPAGHFHNHLLDIPWMVFHYGCMKIKTLKIRTNCRLNNHSFNKQIKNRSTNQNTARDRWAKVLTKLEQFLHVILTQQLFFRGSQKLILISFNRQTYTIKYRTVYQYIYNRERPETQSILHRIWHIDQG